jgi:outer membrane cobalamin receptor
VSFLEKRYLLTVKRFLCFSAACAFFMTFAAASYAAVSLPEEKVIADVAVSEDIYLSPGTVTVVRPEDYAGEARSAADLLGRVPGVAINEKGANGTQQPYIRGGLPTQTAIYIDGVSYVLTGEMMYAAGLDRIPYDQIERIEVYRGFVPARFGNQAMGGVINIVTRMPKEKETNLSVGLGSYGKYRTALSHAAPLGDGVIFVSLGYESYKGDFDYWNDGIWTDGNFSIHDDPDLTTERRGDVMQNADFALKWSDENWRFRAGWIRRTRDAQDKEGDYPGASGYYFTAGGRLPLFDSTRWDFSLGRTQTNGALRWEWDVSYSDAVNEYTRFVPGNDDDINYGFKRTMIALHGELPLGERHLLSAAAEYVDEKFLQHTAAQTQADYTHEEINLNIQDEIALDTAGTLIFTPSLRYNKVAGNDRLTWQSALSKEFGNGLMLKTAYGTYARMPNMYEQYGDGGIYMYANPDLKPETGKQFDVGISWRGVAQSLSI